MMNSIRDAERTDLIFKKYSVRHDFIDSMFLRTEII